MADISPTERIIRTLEGKPVDRVPVFCALLEDRAFNEVLGRPIIPPIALIKNPVSAFFLDKWGPALTKPVIQPFINTGLEKRIKAASKLGFDATWAVYDETFTVLDSKTMARFSGSIFEIQDDGYGNATYMYKCPGITSRVEFEEWPYWAKPDEVAQRVYRFFNRMMGRYGEEICLVGQGSAYGIQESLLWTLGFERMPLWIRREKDLVQRYIAWAEELCLKTIMAMLDAGIKVVLQPDDMAFKTGPMMNPKILDELFGPSYTRIIKAVHDRGAKFILHSCGDNTRLFDLFLKWGVDGLHAYENTSNVDIFEEKRIHGEKVTIVGGVGVDYTLTDRSSDAEVEAEVKNLIHKLAPGGRFILSAAHGLSSTPADKMRVMVEAAKRWGRYPITL